MRRSKYGAVKTTIDGIVFASMMEAKRYQDLKLLERAGEIRDLALQPRFDLHVGAGFTDPIGRYIADFCYHNVRSGQTIVEDVKGFKTPLYRWKKKHVEAQYGITIREL